MDQLAVQSAADLKLALKEGIRPVKMHVVPPLTKKHSATVILLHGAASSGEDFEKWIYARLGRKLEFEQIKLLYPTAKPQNCSLAMGGERNVWFDLENISPLAKEDLGTINNRCVELERLIDREVRRGVPPEKIVVVGFSMGAIMALHLGLSHRNDLAGIGILAGFLNLESSVYKKLKEEPNRSLPPVYWAHGKDDMIARYRWGKKTFDKLLNLGVKGEFVTYENLEHNMCLKELEDLENWIAETVNSI